MTGRNTELAEVAHTWLPPDIADRFLGLVRPAIRLDAAGADDLPVGHLGGEPALPEDMPWPVWLDDQPVPFICHVAFDRLAGYDVDIDLPTAGSLLIFRPDLEAPPDPDLGTRLIYVPPGTAVTRRAAPPGTDAYPHRPLAARRVLTWPSGAEPAFLAEFGNSVEAADLLWRRTHDGQSFSDALRQYDRRANWRGPDHQIGGYVSTSQNSVVYQAAGAAVGHYDYRDPSFTAEAAKWTALLQLSEDPSANLVWGDGALLYWAIRTDDLSAGTFDRVYFECQGH
jgi:uncharacterized protein YwqG